MSAPAATLPHAQAILTALTNASLTAFLGEAGKAGDGTIVAPPYVIVHAVPALVRSTADSDRGTLADPNKDADFQFQTTCVGAGADQVLNLHDLVVAALLGATPTIAGRTTVAPIVPDGRAGTITRASVQRDDTLADPLFYCAAYWTWRTSA